MTEAAVVEQQIYEDAPIIIPIFNNETSGDFELVQRHNRSQKTPQLEQTLLERRESEFWISMREHVASTKNLMNCTLTLAFKDCEVEKRFMRYMGERYKGDWSLIGLVGILFMILLQSAFYLIWSRTVGEFKLEILLVAIVYLPCLFITGLVYFCERDAIAPWIQPLAALYIIFMVPVFILCKSLLLTSFNPLLSAAYYITALFFFIYFLRLRFLHSVIVCLVSFPTWLAVSFTRTASRQVTST